VNATVLNEPPVSASVPTPADDTGGTENVATVGVGHADAATQTGGTTVNGTRLGLRGWCSSWTEVSELYAILSFGTFSY
jgi:hypothetical protein